MKTIYFDHFQTAAMKEAFDEAWYCMRFVGATGEKAVLLREQIASAIVEVASLGERNPHDLCHHALRRIPPVTRAYASDDRRE
ncbi:MAG: hypothetical protein JWL93_2614 [Hyphomicrobiales bacterium]|nr:hypothetical protein [Hyphomicrobiales bacterium]